MSAISVATGCIEYFEWGPHDAAHYILVLHEAATGVRVVAQSLQHYGNTTLHVPGDYVTQHVSVANACLEQLMGNTAVTVFGHSMGGLTALKLALSTIKCYV